MAERIIVRQGKDFETEFLVADPEKSDADEFLPVEHVHALTPYAMLLAGLGACTGIILHTYAQSRGIGLRQVELRLRYARSFNEDCQRCDEIEKYEEKIELEVALDGDLTPEQREKLIMVSRQCPIHKMLKIGVAVESHLAQDQ